MESPKKKIIKMRPIDKQSYRHIMLDLMSEIDRVCTENDIPYTMGGGTLLGAVRHKGFIPWDDDIDIFLERQDYDRLLVLLKNSKCEWLDVVDDKINEYYYPFAKAVNNKTKVKMESSVIEHGIWIDIFPMENVPDNASKRKFFLKRCQLYRAIILSMTTDFSTQKINFKTILKYVLKVFAKIVGYSRIYRWSCTYMKKYNNVTTNCESITWSPYGTEFIEKEMMRHLQTMDFEDRKFKGVADFDTLLRRAYGDYMKLPPENKRRTHGVTAWYV